jgi:hypothetical protein
MFGPVTKCPSDAIAIFQQAGDRAFHVDGDPQLHAAVLQSADHFKARTVAIPLQLLGHGRIASVPFTPCGTKSYSGESCSATLDASGEGVQGRFLISWERARALQVESGPHGCCLARDRGCPRACVWFRSVSGLSPPGRNRLDWDSLLLYFSDLQKYLLIASCLCWNLYLVHNFPVTRVRLCDAQCQFVLVLGVYGPAELDGFVVAFHAHIRIS